MASLIEKLRSTEEKGNRDGTSYAGMKAGSDAGKREHRLALRQVKHPKYQTVTFNNGIMIGPRSALP